MLASIALTLSLVNLTVDGDYHGFKEHTFQVAGLNAIVVEPKKPMRGAPWVWRTEFFDHRPMLDLALLEKGFHLVNLEVGNTFGAPGPMESFSVFYRELTFRWKLNRRVVLEGFSRGGLYAYNWAFLNPDKVMAIYGDAPVCDFKSWPHVGSPDDWKKLVSDYGFPDESAALAYPYNPVDKLEPLATAHIPIIHVVGDVDTLVPVSANTAVIEKRYKALGGTIEVIHKPQGDHHPHSLDDPSPLYRFILKHMGDSGKSPPATVIAEPNPESRYLSAGWGGAWLAQHIDGIEAAKANDPMVVLLGDSITQGWGGPGRKVSAPGSVAFDRYLAKYRAVNMGISGDRTQHLLWRIEHAALAGCNPKVVVILIGVNNRLSDAPEAIALGIEACVSSAHRAAPKAQIVAMEVFPVGVSPTDQNREIVAKVNEHLRKHSKGRFEHLLDIGPDLLLPSGEADLNKMAGDALHLQAAGYEAWGMALQKELTRLIR